MKPFAGPAGFCIEMVTARFQLTAQHTAQHTPRKNPQYENDHFAESPSFYQPNQLLL